MDRQSGILFLSISCRVYITIAINPGPHRQGILYGQRNVSPLVVAAGRCRLDVRTYCPWLVELSALHGASKFLMGWTGGFVYYNLQAHSQLATTIPDFITTGIIRIRPFSWVIWHFL